MRIHHAAFYVRTPCEFCTNLVLPLNRFPLIPAPNPLLGTRNQEDLETLYVKAAEMKIKHLLEVIDRQQDSMSSNGMTFDKVSDATSSKETRLNETITRLQKQVEVMKKHQKEEDLQHAPTLPHSTNTIKEDESDEDSDNSASNDRSKEWKGALTHATPPPTASLQARNDELATSNAIMMEQLERVTNSGASKSKVDELAELLDDKEKAEKRRQVKKNRVTRLHATHADKTETVKNAKEMAMKAQKDRIEKEIEEYEGQVEQLTEDRLFAMFCKQTFVLAKNMKAAEHVDEGADADDDNEDVELVNEEEVRKKSERTEARKSRYLLRQSPPFVHTARVLHARRSLLPLTLASLFV